MIAKPPRGHKPVSVSESPKIDDRTKGGDTPEKQKCVIAEQPTTKLKRALTV